jgi:hypothetical protein
MSSTIPSTIEEFCRTCKGLLYYNAKRWYRPYLDSTHEDYYQVAMAALIRDWGDCPADAEERRVWVWKVINRASQKLHRRDIRNACRLSELGEGGSLEQLAVGEDLTGIDWCTHQERLQQVRLVIEQLPHPLRVVMDRLYGLDGLPAAETYYQTAIDVGLHRDVVAERVEKAHGLLRGALNAYAI